MELKNQKSLKIFLTFILFSSFTPLIQLIFEPLKLKGLDGAFIEAEEPVLNYSNWTTSEYQNQVASYLKQNTPFRADFVRLRNQLNYWFFDEINTIFTLGKENYIFDPNYIKARTGEDYITDELQQKKIEAIKTAKKVLDSLDIPIIVLIAPNKANYFSEFLPSNKVLSSKRNQLFYENLFQNEGIPFINYDKLFAEKKDESQHPLIPKYGAHWSIYGAHLAGLKMYEKLNIILKKDLGKIELSSLEISEEARYTDDDYLPSLNLIKHWKSPPMAYPTLSFSIKEQPNALIISDSYFWNFYDLNIVQNCFSSETEMWYYNKTKFNVVKDKIGPKEPNLSVEDINDRDVIIILSSDPWLTDFGYGFIEEVANINNK